jgi:NTP pyrophosphatase (non-canonical NTP hydrolase)
MSQQKLIKWIQTEMDSMGKLEAYSYKVGIYHGMQKVLKEIQSGKFNDEVRSEVQWFCKQMESKLQENDHKKHWSTMHPDYLIERLYQEASELWEAIGKRDASEIVKEAADVANFAMMIADVAEHINEVSEYGRYRET